MPAEVFEEALPLRIGILEALPPTPASYPLPALEATGRTESREFLAVVLENPYLRLTVVPDLGGRILRVFDKRTSTDLVSVRDVLLTSPGGPRGAFLPDGIQLLLGEEDRLNSLGPVAFQIEEAMDEGDEAAVWLAESSTAPGISWHLRIALPPDRAEIRFEARIQNRTSQPLLYNGGLSVDPARFGMSALRDSLLPNLRRFEEPLALSPRQVDSWQVVLAPFALEEIAATTVHAAIGLGETVRIQVSHAHPGSKVLLLTETGQTMEAPVDLYPERIAELSLGGLNPQEIAVLSARNDELVRYPASPSQSDPLRLQSFQAGSRHLGHLRYGIAALSARSYEEADQEFETALLYNGDDPLLWWIKAVSQRLLGNIDERAELQNAHFLAPLEPALRAEAFLTQSAEQGREANPLLRPLLPDDLIEVACLLIEHGLLDQASRWIDEALRHADLAMLRYLMAEVLLRGTRMETEAAQHVVLGGRAQVPPNPWRTIEIDALKHLHHRFPNDARLSELLSPFL